MPNLEPAVAEVVTLEQLTAAFDAALGGGDHGPPGERSAFLSHVLDDLRPGELPDVSLADFAGALAGFWRSRSIESGGSCTIRIEKASGADGRDLELDRLEIVQPDAPFLVDSVMGQIAEAGASVKAMVHPLVDYDGHRLSMIQVWLAPMAEERQAVLIDRVRAALADTRAAVGDFGAMRDLLGRCVGELRAAAPGDVDDLAEYIEFLHWVDDGHFVFLGAREYEYPRTADGGYAAEEPIYHAEGSFGVLRDQALTVLRRASEPAVLSAALRRSLEAAEPVVVAKSNLHSRVHRRAYMDYIGVRRYGADGKPFGEVRFVGLFTSQAYIEPARSTPLLRRKIARVMAAAGFPKGSHNAMRLGNILETYPRDELFQVGVAELLATALDILHLFDRPRVKLFARRDPFDRFISILVYAPRERYDDRLRQRAGQILSAAFSGRISAYYPSYSDAPLARVHYIVGVTPGGHAEPDLAEVEDRIAHAARTWSDDLESAIYACPATAAKAQALLSAYDGAFPIGYRDHYDGGEALADLIAVEQLGPDDQVTVRAFRVASDSPLQFRFKLYRRGEAPAALARVLPVLEDMGLSALVEEGFRISPRDAAGEHASVWIHEFILEDERGEHLTFESIKAPFEDAFNAVWSGATECDGFNRLVLELSLTWREAALVRALARCRQQSGLDPRQPIQEAAVCAHPEVTRLILQLFTVRFDPATGDTNPERAEKAAATSRAIEEALRAVESLDDDRVLRRLAALVGAITRTNYYQPAASGEAKPYISFKVASRELVDLPAPKPFREIFVSAPNVEGVHLRFGPVARGGLRWSDRRDDFRTEVLGLVKAQQVKNAVIVPVGSKGGFYPKGVPRGADALTVRSGAIAAYRTFLCGLLDLTDNIDADGAVVHPANVIIHDLDDPYLVVAADKGTATFSDIANAVAEDYGFWLGDAFASGGSAGYDHKAMGITARGAWESVKRHFRELGKDVQRDPVSVIGVGDMSGDVFGNGMLLSKTLRLRAAFDHRHIFLDPDPDPARAWAERKRLFEMPTSSWNDYDRTAISAGGGVFARALKSIPLSEPVRAMLEVKVDALAPNDLITAILKSRAELLYLGGIGTYVKASTEANLDVGDKANDPVRVSGRDLRCKVVGEGANLGLTQAGRIEFALAGGRIDTDAIDNSAGVDTSDHEVNIKILTGMAERAGELTRPDRDKLLASMTDDIAQHVLAHNYDQTLALSLLEAGAARNLEYDEQFMLELETAGRLDRALEGLPNAAVVAARREAGKGLTRPELAVMLAYGKLELFENIIGSDAPDDPFFRTTLESYFPRALRGYDAEMRGHRLRREIIATVIDNEMINICGPTFPGRLREAAACDTPALVAAFEAARQILRFRELWSRVERLDGKAPAAAQTALFRELVDVLRGLTFWLARRAAREGSDINALTRAYRPAADALKRLVPGVLSPFEQKAAVRRASVWVKAGAPRDVAHSVALARPLTLLANVSDLATTQGWSLDQTAYLYHRIGGMFSFDRLRAAAVAQASNDSYERLATRRLVEDMLTEQAALAGAIMTFAGRPGADEDPTRATAIVGAWSIAHAPRVKLAKSAIEEIEKSPGGWTFAKLTIANGALRELASAPSPLQPAVQEH
jgi:glutamate dehydrogenase